MRARITKRTVDAAAPGARDSFLWDAELKGFGLKVTPAGRKVYIVQTRLNGSLKRYTIGVHGSSWTPEAARREALSLLGTVQQGEDPSTLRGRIQAAAMTVSGLCDLYLAEGCGGKKASTVHLDHSRISRHIVPLLGKKRVADLTRADLERFLVDVAAGKTAIDEKTRKRGRAIVKGGKGTATRTMGLVGAILQFAVNRGIRPDNPARGIKRYPDKKFDRFLSSDELKRLGEAFRQAETDGGNAYALGAIRLLLLTGMRKSEALTLKWDWVDSERSCLRLPDSKSGGKPVPLGEPALKLVQSMPRVQGNPHVFVGSKEGHHFVGLQKVWERIRKSANLDDLRLHDLRHHFISTGASSGESLYILGKVAGHRQTATTQRYAHLADDPVRGAADRVSERIAATIDTKVSPD